MHTQNSHNAHSTVTTCTVQSQVTRAREIPSLQSHHVHEPEIRVAWHAGDDVDDVAPRAAAVGIHGHPDGRGQHRRPGVRVGPCGPRAPPKVPVEGCPACTRRRRGTLCIKSRSQTKGFRFAPTGTSTMEPVPALPDSTVPQPRSTFRPTQSSLPPFCPYLINHSRCK